jgi:tetraacyldisaccharide 4'-kinase
VIGGPDQPPVPVLVVGNLVVGGGGKTPTVIAMTQALLRAGHRPGIVSRGHGRRGDSARAVTPDAAAVDVGDEPLLIARRTGGPVWVGRDRPAAARALCMAHPDVDVLIADDGLQHRALARQAEIIVFDGRGAGNGLLMPAGPLRQPLPGTLAAHSRVLYTAGRASTALPGWVGRRRIDTAWPLAAWRAGDGRQALPLQALQGRPLLAVAGIAAPEAFFAMLRASGLDVQGLALPDHHAYATVPWVPGTPDVVTTEKDAVKLSPTAAGATRVWVVPLDLSLPDELVGQTIALLFPAAAP